MLELLTGACVEFVIVGPHAARARGIDLAGFGLQTGPLQVTPAPGPKNLQTLTQALDRAGGARLNLGDDQHEPMILLHPRLFRHVAVLPLSTGAGLVTIVLHPVGGPMDYLELINDTSAARLDGVEVLVPTLPALLYGLVGGWQAPDPRLLAALRRQQHEDQLAAIWRAQTNPPEIERSREGELEAMILSTLESLGQPATVRDLMLALSSWRVLNYAEVRRAANALAYRGRLMRRAVGNANTYCLPAVRTGQVDEVRLSS